MANIALFSQIISKLDRSKFSKIVKDKETDKQCKGYNCWIYLFSKLFCQFAKSQSIRDISNGLLIATGNLYHLGIEKAPSKSTISYQNKKQKTNTCTFQRVLFSIASKFRTASKV